jgi:hypothetical protein
VFGSGKGPVWLGFLLAAEEWGTPPWEIMPGKPRLWWYTRWSLYRRYLAERQKN